MTRTDRLPPPTTPELRVARSVDYNDGRALSEHPSARARRCTCGCPVGRLMPPTSQAATSKVRFRRVASGGVAAVAASGRWVFYISDRLVRDPSGQLHTTGTTGTLLDEHTGRRQRLTPPDCPQLIAAMMGGPWLYVECWPSSPTGVPSPLLYNLANRTWTTVIARRVRSGLVLTSVGTWPEDLGGVGLGRSSIEFKLGCYQLCQTRTPCSQSRPGHFKDTSAVNPGGRISTFDLNSQAGMQPLCHPLTYPAVTYRVERKNPTRAWLDRAPGTIRARRRAVPPTGGSLLCVRACLPGAVRQQTARRASQSARGPDLPQTSVPLSGLPSTRSTESVCRASRASRSGRPGRGGGAGGVCPLIALSATSVYAIDMAKAGS